MLVAPWSTKDQTKPDANAKGWMLTSVSKSKGHGAGLVCTRRDSQNQLWPVRQCSRLPTTAEHVAGSQTKLI